MMKFPSPLRLDASEAQEQVEELLKLLSTTFPKGLPEDSLNDITKLLLELGLGEEDVTMRAVESGEFVVRIKFGNIYNKIMAAIWAGELSDFLYKHKPGDSAA